MTWFGKILAVLNIPVALAFVVLAFMDYSKRAAWEYANFVHDLAVTGLPLSETETDEQGLPVYRELSRDTKKEWFGADPVSTQLEEVNKVKEAVRQKIEAAGDPQKQTALSAKALTPFARTYPEREWLIALQVHLADDASLARLKNRLRTAFSRAVDNYALQSKGATFPALFEAATAAQGGQPSHPFDQTFLEVLPVEPKKPFDKALEEAQAAVQAKPGTKLDEAFLLALHPAKDFDTAFNEAFADTLKALNGWSQRQVDLVFDEAVQGKRVTSIGDSVLSTTPKTEQLTPERQKAAVAHVLFNTVETLQDDAAARGFAAGSPYDRLTKVVGLKATVAEVNAQAETLVRVARDLDAEVLAERGAFADAQHALVLEIQQRAVALDELNDRKARREKERDAVKDLIDNRRTPDVTKAEADLANERKQTAAKLKELRGMSQSLYDIRLQVRDAAADNNALEQKIGKLEEGR